MTGYGSCMQDMGLSGVKLLATVAAGGRRGVRVRRRAGGGSGSLDVRSAGHRTWHRATYRDCVLLTFSRCFPIWQAGLVLAETGRQGGAARCGRSNGAAAMFTHVDDHFATSAINAERLARRAELLGPHFAEIDSRMRPAVPRTTDGVIRRPLCRLIAAIAMLRRRASPRLASGRMA